jgi:hypothetical protein
MADRYTDIVVLCEDIMHFNFVRRYLIHRGIEQRRIRINMAPPGRGAASQYVIENYPMQVKAIRGRPDIRAGLLVVIDADTSSANGRFRQLERSLIQSDQPGRRADERIGLLSPRRNIETWVFLLLGNAANEDDDYKHRVSPSDLKRSVMIFAEMCPGKLNKISLPSLEHGCRELTTFLGRGR